MQIETSHASSRYTLMNEIMERTDLSNAEIRLCWLLLIRIMNNETGLCYCSDRHIAKQLSINAGTVYRAKHRLKQLGILDWSKQPACKRAGTPTSFKFNLLRLHTDRQPNREHAGRVPAQPQAPTACTHAGTKVPAQPQAPQNTPDADRRIGAGLQQLAAQLKGIAPITPAPQTDAEQFLKWRNDYARSQI